LDIGQHSNYLLFHFIMQPNLVI